MNIRGKRIYFVTAALLVALTGCKSLPETAEGKMFTSLEGVTLMTENEIKSTLVGNTIHWYSLEGTYKGGKSIVMAGDPKHLSR